MVKFIMFGTQLKLVGVQENVTYNEDKKYQSTENYTDNGTDRIIIKRHSTVIVTVFHIFEKLMESLCTVIRDVEDKWKACARLVETWRIKKHQEGNDSTERQGPHRMHTAGTNLHDQRQSNLKQKLLENKN